MLSKDRLQRLQETARAACRPSDLYADLPIAPIPDISMEELCQCGRLRRKIHCPHCGSYAMYGTSKYDVVTRPDGQQYRVTVCKCRRCGMLFNHDEWLFRCQAPNQRLGRPNQSPEALQGHKPDIAIPAAMMDAMDKVMSMPCGGCGKPRRDCICVRED